MKSVIVWLRRDLRLQDNPALAYAAKQDLNLIPLYIDEPGEYGQAQAWWLHHSLLALSKAFSDKNVRLVLRRGQAMDVFKELLKEVDVDLVCWQRLYEPETIERDKAIKALLKDHGIAVESLPGNYFIEPWLVKNQQGGYFKVFTPFWRHVRAKLELGIIPRMPSLHQSSAVPSEQLDDWALLPAKPNWAQSFEAHWSPGEKGAKNALNVFLSEALEHYAKGRDCPSRAWTSHLSPHLHFGEISVSEIFSELQALLAESPKLQAASEKFLSELGWREFSMYLLYHYPDLAKKNFNTKFNGFPWSRSEKNYTAWCHGLTGYPIVDAGMRELWQTGYMHNRVRMVVASFLTKHLLIDWRKGAQWFFETLLDADLANNSASWQWVAGCGADAAPYFRIFNPILQGEKFDPEGDYVKRWLPELQALPKKYIHQPWMASELVLSEAGIVLGEDYPLPIVDHTAARKRALTAYKELKS